MFVSGGDPRLELRYILERVRRRMSVAKTLSGSSWQPMEVDIPPGERFLVFAPHPDDDAIGCGGTILKLIQSGKAVRVAYLSLQSSARFSREERLREIQRSSEAMGVKDYAFLSEEFPSKVADRGLIGKELSSYRPDTVFVPSPLENHDHHIETFEAYVESKRVTRGEEDTALYEIWTPLIPNMIVDITRFMDRKLDAVNAHKTQIMDIDLSRAVEGLNKYRSAISNKKGYCEAFMFLDSLDLFRTFPH